MSLAETFTCEGCKHTLPMEFNMRTPGFCYMCDPNVTLDELLNDKPVEEQPAPDTRNLKPGAFLPQIYAWERVMALSWKQPFASLMLHGKIETRTWATAYRGWVLICASKKPYTDLQTVGITGTQQYANYQLIRCADKGDWMELCGKAIAIARLVDCRPMRQEDEDKCFVAFYPDLYCHVYADVHAIKPFDWKGSQGWRELTEEQLKQIVIL